MSDPRDADLRRLARGLVADAPPPPAFDDLDARPLRAEAPPEGSSRPGRRAVVVLAACLVVGGAVFGLSRVPGTAPASVDVASGPVPSTLPSVAGERMGLLRSSWDDPSANVVTVVDRTELPRDVVATSVKLDVPADERSIWAFGGCSFGPPCAYDAERSFVARYRGAGDDGRDHDVLAWVLVPVAVTSAPPTTTGSVAVLGDSGAVLYPGVIPSRAGSSLVVVTVIDARTGTFITSGALVAIR